MEYVEFRSVVAVVDDELSGGIDVAVAYGWVGRGGKLDRPMLDAGNGGRISVPPGKLAVSSGNRTSAP